MLEVVRDLTLFREEAARGLKRLPHLQSEGRGGVMLGSVGIAKCSIGLHAKPVLNLVVLHAVAAIPAPVSSPDC